MDEHTAPTRRRIAFDSAPQLRQAPVRRFLAPRRSRQARHRGAASRRWLSCIAPLLVAACTERAIPRRQLAEAPAPSTAAPRSDLRPDWVEQWLDLDPVILTPDQIERFFEAETQRPEWVVDGQTRERWIAEACAESRSRRAAALVDDWTRDEARSCLAFMASAAGRSLAKAEELVLLGYPYVHDERLAGQLSHADEVGAVAKERLRRLAEDGWGHGRVSPGQLALMLARAMVTPEAAREIRRWLDTETGRRWNRYRHSQAFSGPSLRQYVADAEAKGLAVYRDPAPPLLLPK